MMRNQISCGLGTAIAVTALCGCRSAGDQQTASHVRPLSDRARFDFEQDPVGKPPNGWQISQTNPTTALATWKVIDDHTAPGGAKVLALTDTKNYDGTFNLAIAESTSFQNIDLSVRIKAVGGAEDQGGGPIWRCQDANNYYICRYNPLEANFRVYFVKNGRRKQLDTVKTETVPGRWYVVRVTMVGRHITCYLDDHKLLEAEDNTFVEAGHIGVWTKADAATCFDDLEAREIKSGGS